MEEKKQHETAYSADSDLEAPATVEIGEIKENGDLKRSLSPRQIHVISLGCNIGSGLFIGTGKALANGGPGGMIMGYFMVCLGVWAHLQTLAEMTIAFPTSGNYIDYADRWVDPALAFGAGLAEWLGWTAVFASEATFFVVLVNYWAEGSVPEAALLSIFIVICLVVFFMPNIIFGWLQYIGSLVKVFLFIFNIIVCLAIIGGAGPNGQVRDGSTWTDLPAFKNGFGGFANAALLAIWAIGDQIYIGVLSGEAKSPRYSMAHAANVVPWRVGVFYMVSITLISVIVPSDDDRLLGGSGGATTSPFVIAADNAGIKVVPDLINVCIIVGILAIALESIYLPSRILRTMALQNLVPSFIAKVDDKGRPRWALLITGMVGITLTYISLNGKGTEVLNWFISITSASFFINWAIVAFTSFRFHAAIKAQNAPLFQELYAWHSSLWPLAPVAAFVISSLLLVCLLYIAIKPLSDGFTAYSFFQNILGLLIIVVFTALYKVLLKTHWRDPKTADLIRGRRQLSTEEMALMQKHYARPLWRRIGTYVKLW
ncbi:amino acid permease/ SLC12A domain-containing protein [Aspergillus unguis]